MLILEREENILLKLKLSHLYQRIDCIQTIKILPQLFW